MKNGSDAIAIRARGFWSANRFHQGSLPSNQSSEKWVIFASGLPVISEYFDLSGDISSMLTPEGRVKMQKYNDDTIRRKRLILHALDIYDEIEDNDDIALWEVNYTSDRDYPGALSTSAEEYHDNDMANYGLSNGAFVKAMADDSELKRNICFAIEELLEIRSVILYPDGRYTRFKKKPGVKMIKEKGTMGD